MKREAVPAVKAYTPPPDPHAEQAAAMRDRGYLTVSDAADMIMVSDASIYAWLKDGTLVGVRVGKRAIYVHVDEVRKLMGPLAK